MDPNDKSENERLQQQRRIEELLLIGRNLQEISDKERRELNDLLRNDDENRRFASKYLLDTQSLQNLLASNEASAIWTGKTSKPFQPRSRSPFNKKRAASSAIAAAIALLAIIGFQRKDFSAIAVIQDESGAYFTEDPISQGSALQKKTYTLVSGIITIKFRNGVTMATEAPARFDIVSDFRVRLHHGRVRAFAPETGHGFVIETPDLDIEDLGTEFGVSVDSESGSSAVHVFNGRVDLKSKIEKNLLASLTIGNSASINNGNISLSSTPPPHPYPIPEGASYARWRNYTNKIKEDEHLLIHYEFSKEDENSNILKNDAPYGSPVDGYISKARWVSGRWQKKRALLFDGQGESVQFKIPKELTQFTFSVWVKLDRMDEPLSAVLNSVGWESGCIHMQIPRGRNTFSIGTFPLSKKEYTGAQVPFGRWTLLTAVVDIKEKIATTWVNTAIAINARLQESTPIKPGAYVLGGNLNTAESEVTRGFCGRIDEIYLWDRALEPKEIRKLFQKGRLLPHAANDS